MLTTGYTMCILCVNGGVFMGTAIQATIQKWGNSHGVRLSKAVLSAAGISESDSVDVEVGENVITLRKIERPKRLKDLFAGYTGDYRPTEAEFDTGDSIGLEVID